MVSSPTWASSASITASAGAISSASSPAGVAAGCAVAGATAPALATRALTRDSRSWRVLVKVFSSIDRSTECSMWRNSSLSWARRRFSAICFSISPRAAANWASIVSMRPITRAL